MGTSVLLVTGTLGSGKTEVVREINEVLRTRGVSNATIDLDWIGKGRQPSDWPQPTWQYGSRTADLQVANLRVMWPNYTELGISRLLLAGVIDSRQHVMGVLEAVDATDFTVCRLTAPAHVLRERIERRELGIARDFIVRYSREVEAHLDALNIASMTVANDGSMSITAVAEKILADSGWATD
jgi:hypothetical protein